MLPSTGTLIDLIDKARTIAEGESRRTVAYLLGLAADAALDEKRLQGAEPLADKKPAFAAKPKTKRPAKRVEGQREMLLPIAGKKVSAEETPEPNAPAARKKAG